MSFPDGPGGGLTLAGVTGVVPAREDKSGWAIAEKCDETGPEARVMFQVPWAQRGIFIQALLGTCVSVGGTIVRVPAIAYPDNPQLLAVGITDIRGIQPIGGGAETWPTHELAEIDVVFRRPSWQIPSEAIIDESAKPYTTLSKRTAGELRTPPQGAYYYVGGDEVDSATLGIPRGWIEYQLVRHAMPPGIMDPILANAVNKVNDSALVLGNQSYAHGFVLCAAATSEPNADAAGNVTDTVVITMIALLDHEHNERQQDDGTWALVNTASDGSGDYIYDYMDFYQTLFPDVT